MAAMNCRVLIVEDVADMRELLAHLVGELAGFRVSGKCGNAWEARIELARRRPEVVLLDEVLPEPESSGDLLKDFAEAGIPVVLITGADLSIGARASQLPPGAVARIGKPQAGANRELAAGRRALEEALARARALVQTACSVK